MALVNGCLNRDGVVRHVVADGIPFGGANIAGGGGDGGGGGDEEDGDVEGYPP